jgi:hypothetical protein
MRLCSTCRHDPGCVLRRQKDFRAAYCEEFEGPPVVEAAPEPARALAPAAGGTTFQGLCGNCLNRETCQLASCDGGVWHCEEYQ